ncbi:hypothetical protein LEMLEM_LOCUS16554, partial [Lemmus lemmus]
MVYSDTTKRKGRNLTMWKITRKSCLNGKGTGVQNLAKFCSYDGHIS